MLDENNLVNVIASKILSEKKVATIGDVEKELSKKHFTPRAAAICLQRLAKYGFVERIGRGEFRHVATLSPRQDYLLRKNERKSSLRRGSQIAASEETQSTPKRRSRRQNA